MSNSNLVEYIKISPNKSVPRNHKIDTITIHCMAGQLSVETCGNVFSSLSAEASSNYGVGEDGRIAMYVEEKDRSWCSSNRENDNRAVTIEVASNSYHPYAVSDAAYQSTIKLVADICKRNGIEKLVWSDDKYTRIAHANGANMTVHRDFANKACPGDYLYNRMGDIAAKVNAILSETNSKNKGTVSEEKGISCPYTVNIIAQTVNVRSGPGKEYEIVRKVNRGEVFTIVEVRKNNKITWGRLKSGAGWINLANTKKR